MSRFDDSQINGDTPLHETEHYRVYVGTIRTKGEFEGLRGYTLVNRATGITEGEFTVEYAAIRAMRELNEKLVSALQNDPEQVADAADFDTMMEELAKRFSE